jgi:hypothetical protein
MSAWHHLRLQGGPLPEVRKQNDPADSRRAIDSTARRAFDQPAVQKTSPRMRMSFMACGGLGVTRVTKDCETRNSRLDVAKGELS